MIVGGATFRRAGPVLCKRRRVRTPQLREVMTATLFKSKPKDEAEDPSTLCWTRDPDLTKLRAEGRHATPPGRAKIPSDWARQFPSG